MFLQFHHMPNNQAGLDCRYHQNTQAQSQIRRPKALMSVNMEHQYL
jgi:hypothetical protein